MPVVAGFQLSNFRITSRDHFATVSDHTSAHELELYNFLMIINIVLVTATVAVLPYEGAAIVTSGNTKVEKYHCTIELCLTGFELADN